MNTEQEVLRRRARSARSDRTPRHTATAAATRPGWPARLAGIAALLLPLVQGVPALAATPPPTIDYVRLPALSELTVSPSNQHAAMLVLNHLGRKVLAVIDLERPAELRVVAAYKDADVESVQWVNDRRLVYEAYTPGTNGQPGGAGTMAVDLNGENRLQLITFNRGSNGALPRSWDVWRSVDERSDEVLVYRSARDRVGEVSRPRQIARLNTVSGGLTNLSLNQPPHANHWLFNDKGELRLVVSQREGRQRLHLRAPSQTEWATIEDQPADGEAQIQPLYLEPDGRLIVSTRRGRDTQALYAYDTAKKALADDPLVAVNGYDVDGALITDGVAGAMLGVWVQASQWIPVWFDPRLNAVQQAVDKALPAGRSNALLCGRCLTAERFVVQSSGPRQEAEYFIFDSGNGNLTPLGAARPWLAEQSQGERSFHRVAARDGLPLPVVVTHPPGSARDQPLPTVVLVHGGPWVRGATLEWSAWPQFLASRGYRVLEVDFRGSTGLGWKHFRASWKQWGQAMQDDLADAVAWAVQANAVDPQRVCIAGASYGGYAALMGPVRHPELYRCAASFAGVTDLALMFSTAGTDIPADLRQHSLPDLIGDPRADAELLRRHSPLHRVAEIKVPVLLGLGWRDRRVADVHAERFVSAARRAGVELERVDYTEEGHGFVDPANEASFLDRLEAFLARSLKPAAVPPTAPARP